MGKSSQSELDYARRIRDERREQGLCTTCGKVKARQRGSLCEGCAEDVKNYARERRTRRLLARQCPHCGSPVEGGYRYCASYRREKKERVRERRRKEK